MYESIFWDNFYTNKISTGIPWREPEWIDICSKVFDEILSYYESGSLLDYGCGLGDYFDCFKKKKINITGVDISTFAINYCKTHFDNNCVQLINGDTPHCIEGKYDIIIFWGTIHHINPQMWCAFLSEFKEHLSDNGTFIISGWNKKSERFKNMHQGQSEFTELTTWAIDNIEPLLNRYFTITKRDFISYHNTNTDSFSYYFCKSKNLDFITKLKHNVIESIKPNINTVPFFQLVKYSIKNDLISAEMDIKNSMVYYREENEMLALFHRVINQPKCHNVIANITHRIYEQPTKSNLFVFYERGASKVSICDNRLNAEKTFSFNSGFINTNSIVVDDTCSIFCRFNQMTLEQQFEKIEKMKDITYIPPPKYQIDKHLSDADNELAKTFFYAFFSDHEDLYFYYFVNPTYYIKGVEIGDGVLILYSTKLLEKEVVEKINTEYLKWSAALSVESFTKKIKQESIRAALSTVIARNLSHNLGSHVLVKVVNIISQIFFKEGYVPPPEQFSRTDESDSKETCLAKEIEYLKKKMKDDTSLYNKHAKKLYGPIHIEDINKLEEILKHVNRDGKDFQFILTLLNYIKVRMDYIADITTGTPVMENIKSFRTEVIAGFRKNRFLIDTISGIDNFKYSFDIFYNNENINNNDTKDVQLAIPNDVLGNQAFYVIIENIIRNVAKHGSSNEVSFEIKIDEAEEHLKEYLTNKKRSDVHPHELYAVSIIIRPSNEKNEKSNHITHKKKTIIIDNYKKEHPTDTTENVDKITEAKEVHWIAFEQNEIINRSILHKDTGQLRQGGWGILEMETAAAYLRKIPKEDIEGDEYEVKLFSGSSFDNDTFFNENYGRINILRAYVEDEKYLAYRIFIYKPREILIVGEKNKVFENASVFSPEIEKSWISSGIKVIDRMEAEIYPQRLVVDYTNGEGLSEKVGFSRHVLAKPTIITDCTEIINVKTNLWIQYENEFKKHRQFLDRGQLNQSSDHGANYYNQIREFKKKGGNVYLEIETSDNKQYTNKGVVGEWTNTKNKNLNLPLSKQWTISCNAKIKVIDERIQDFALNSSPYPTTDGEKIRYLTIFKYTNILIPASKKYHDYVESADNNVDKDIDHKDCLNDLNEHDFDKSYNAIIQYIQMHKDIDYLVIHLGIIEKIISSYNNANISSIPFNKEIPVSNEKAKGGSEKTLGVKDFIENVLCRNKNGELIIEYDKVIVISGRGQPHNLPDDIRFLNYSVVAQYLIDRRCKYAFAEAIHSARRFRKIIIE